jgi:hypothetical protein
VDTPKAPAPPPRPPALPPGVAPFPPPTAWSAPPPPEERFGGSGQIVLTAGLGSAFLDDNSQSVSLSPSVSVFIPGSFSFGAGLNVGYVKNKGASATTDVGLNVRFGYNARLGSRLSLWPTFLVGAARPFVGSNYSFASVQVPLLVHIVPHFFLAGGPFVTRYQFAEPSGAAVGSLNRAGLTTFIGGWF